MAEVRSGSGGRIGRTVKRRLVLAGVGAALVAAVGWHTAERAARADELAHLAALPARASIVGLAAFAERTPDTAEARSAIVRGLSSVERHLIDRKRAFEEGVASHEPIDAPPGLRPHPIDETDATFAHVEEPDVEEMTTEDDVLDPSDARPSRASRAPQRPPVTSDFPDLDAAIRRLGNALAHEMTNRPNDRALHDARRCLERVRLGGTEPGNRWVRFRSDDTIEINEVEEALDVSFHPVAANARLGPYLDGTPPTPPIARRTIHPVPNAWTSVKVPLPPPGRYLLEVRSVVDGWRRLKPLVVTDLEIVTQAYAGGFVVLACFGGEPAADVAVSCLGEVRARTDASGLAIIPLAAAANAPVDVTAELAIGDDIHAAWANARSVGDAHMKAILSAHTWTDRTTYRRGERVVGRVVVRRHVPRSFDGAFGPHGRRPETAPAAGLKLELEARFAGTPTTYHPIETDAEGAAAFAVTVPKRALRTWFHLRPVIRRDKERVPIGTSLTLDVADWVRPDLLLDVDWPETVHEPVTITGRHPSGAPAVGRTGTLAVAGRSLTPNGMPRKQAFRLDETGRAVIGILAAPASDADVRLDVTMRAANGRDVSQSHVIRPRREEATTTAARIRSDDDTETFLGPTQVRVGDRARYEIPLIGRALLTIGRETAYETHVLTPDDDGIARFDVTFRRAWWPRVHLVAEHLHGARGADRAHLAVELDDPAHRLAVDVTGLRKTYRPGEAVSCTVRTTTPDGRPVPATVALSVIDEAFLAETPWRRRRASSIAVRTAAESALRPAWSRLTEVAFRSLPFGPPNAIDWLLHRGRVPAPYTLRWIDFRAGWPELGWGRGRGRGRRYGGAGGARVRRDFTPTAACLPAVATGDDGVAEIRFRFPDDLTTWRVTALAVGRDVETGCATHTVRTEQPVAVDVTLPRLVRAGDVIHQPVLIHRRGDAVAERATVDVAADGAIARGGATHACPAGDATARTTIRVEAREAGSGRIAATARNDAGDALDALARTLPVDARTLRTRDARTVRLVGRGVVPVPPGEGPLTLEVRGAHDVRPVLRAAARYLGAYPHGCAEQTCSKMVPILVAHQARRALANDRSLSPTDEHAARVRAGIERLATMQRTTRRTITRRTMPQPPGHLAPVGGFAWWPTQREVDLRMSAVVFQFLARAKEAGFDLGDAIAIDAELPVFTYRRRRLAQTPPNAVAADLAIARFSLDPTHDEARADARDLAAHADTIAFATAARLGRALARAGERALANDVFERLIRRRVNAPAASATSFEQSTVCRMAALLELALALERVDLPLIDDLVAELLARSDGGRLDHTAGTAAALAALTELPGRADDQALGNVTVRVTTPRGERIVRVAPSTRDRNDAPDPRRLVAPDTTRAIDLPADATAIAVASDSTRACLATATRHRTVDGANAAPSTAPLAISRRSFAIAPGPNDALVRSAPIDGDLTIGQIVEVEVTLTTPVAVHYGLIDCPIPAGFEVVLPDDRPRRDRDRRSDAPTVTDRSVKFALPSVAAGTIRRSFRMVAAWRGTVVWPPARAFAMYAPDLQGTSAGAQLTVTRCR